VLEYLRKAKRPCGYQDVFEEIEAHHQSIQNSLRDLEKRGYAMKLGPNQWIATDQTRGGLTVM
jgi:DNA-binding IclR family transcriptional regulator